MKKILMIEDDKLVGRVYSCRFELERFEVKLAEDGVEGLAAIPVFKPDAVILDLMLPKVSGFEILRRLRADPATEDLPVIVFSNAYLSGVEKDALALGATLCLHKGSSTPRQIVQALNAVLDARAKSSYPSLPISDGEDSSAASEEAARNSVAHLRDEFFEQCPAQIANLKKIAQGVLASVDPARRSDQIGELFCRFRALSSSVELFELTTIARLAGAMEGLLSELRSSPKKLNASAIRTISQGIDFIGQLLQPQIRQQTIDYPVSPRILVVDDDAISRKAVTRSLEKGQLTSVDLEDPYEAERYIKENRMDLVILDVEMPGLNGFELCQKLRALPGYTRIPVIFVTRLSGFEGRKNAAMSGGDDFIAKPFLFLELTVKALIHLLRNKVENAASKQRGSIPNLTN